MSSSNPIIAAADAVSAAAASGTPCAPIKDGISALGIEGAYAVQSELTRRAIAGARTLVGRKIGLTSKAVQTQLGVDQPDYGMLFADMEIADHDIIPLARFLQPRVEAEIAFVLDRDLDDAEITLGKLIPAIAFALPAIEIVDSRIADWKITFADTVADNGSSAMFVLSETRKPLAGLDLWTCGMALEVNGALVSLGAGCACLGHPLNAAAWLAQTLAVRGEPLRAGDIILTGALGPMVRIQPGDSVRATIGGLGTVSFAYGKEGA